MNEAKWFAVGAVGYGLLCVLLAAAGARWNPHGALLDAVAPYQPPPRLS